MRHIPENPWLFSTICYGCTYEEKKTKKMFYHLSENYCLWFVKSPMEEMGWKLFNPFINSRFFRPRGSQKSKNIFLWYVKIISTWVCKKIFLLKQKIQKYFCAVCPKVQSEGENKIFRHKNFKGVSATKSWEKSRSQVWVAWRSFE